MDSGVDEAFDRLTRLAGAALYIPWAFVTLVDDARSFWKSCFGVEAREVNDRQTPVEESFCQYVIATGEPFLIDDARLDDRTSTNPSIVSMGVVAWAGSHVLAADGQVLGTFCVVSPQPRVWTAHDALVLAALAAATASEIRLRDAHGVAAEASTALAAQLGVRDEAAARGASGCPPSRSS